MLEREYSQTYWDKLYGEPGRGPVAETLWLDKYGPNLRESEGRAVIDLGCGRGADTLNLLNRGYDVISCDFSRAALECLFSGDYPVKTACFDMRDGLPFGGEEAHIVIADLSLHYFPWDTTGFVVSEIARILDGGGYLLCRLNSVGDRNFGAGEGREVEKHYYCLDGHYKRFFDRDDIDLLFRGWTFLRCTEEGQSRYGGEKTAWEIALRKPGGKGRNII